ncbi:MAG: ATP synthase subunit I [Nostocaceae cyanobacterium]|nr:ATP synthase subunit I [Nostocaceae cyanobacterium]
MNNIFHLFIALLSGFILGIFYFVSLWVTVRQLPTTQMPIRLFIGSYLGRISITLLGFYLVINGHWSRALVGLLGFLLARILLVNRLQPQRKYLQFKIEE